MNELQIFQYEHQQVRTVQGEGGEPWFVAKDVAEVLGYAVPRKAVYDHCKGCSKTVLPSEGGPQEMTIIPERDVYRLIMRSHLPTAERFEEWVVGEVLPAIRKHGGYLTPDKIEEALLNPDTIIRLAQDLKAEQKKRQLLQAKVERDHSKVLFADSVSASHTSILIGDLAKLLRQNGHEIGQNRLFGWLRENGYLIRAKGASWNMPTQRAMEMNLFEVKERTIDNPDGSIRITKTTKVTGKGQVYFINKFLGRAA